MKATHKTTLTSLLQKISQLKEEINNRSVEKSFEIGSLLTRTIILNKDANEEIKALPISNKKNDMLDSIAKQQYNYHGVFDLDATIKVLTQHAQINNPKKTNSFDLPFSGTIIGKERMKRKINHDKEEGSNLMNNRYFIMNYEEKIAVLLFKIPTPKEMVQIKEAKRYIKDIEKMIQKNIIRRLN